MKNTINKREDGNYDVNISFDITEHGHSFGMPRNYNLAKVTKLIRSKIVQDSVKNGYGICMYGHGARAKEQGYIANERNHNTGNEQEPIGKVTSLSIKNKIITYDAIIALTAGNKGQSVADLIKAGIGGFSFVWDVPNSKFYGADFVLSPNFNGNRIVMDSICSDGKCQLDTSIHSTVLDAIGTHEEMYSIAKDLLENQESSLQAFKLRERVRVMQDSISSLEDEIAEKDIIIENHNVTIKGQNKEIELANKDNSKVTMDAVKKEVEPLNEEIVKLKENTKSLEVLKKSISDSGLILVDGVVELDSASLGNFLSPSSKDKHTFDEVELDALRKPIFTDDSLLKSLNFKY